MDYFNLDDEVTFYANGKVNEKREEIKREGGMKKEGVGRGGRERAEGG